MKDIAIYGAGGLGREVACIIDKLNRIEPTWNLVGFFDDGIRKGETNEYGKILGGLDELNSWKTELSVVLGIGNPKVVRSLVDKIRNENILYPNIIAPDVKFLDSENYRIGKGNYINFGCSVSCNVQIGDFNTIGAFTSLGHDCQIGNFNTLMPSVQICGYVTVGTENFFGISSIVLQQHGVGKGVTLGAGSILMKDAEDDRTYFGNPARAIISNKH